MLALRFELAALYLGLAAGTTGGTTTVRAGQAEGVRAVELLDNPVRPYAWGSRTAIAELLGRPVPAAHPEAELWFGAHPGDPSAVSARTGRARCSTCSAADPAGQLGRAVATRGASGCRSC